MQVNPIFNFEKLDVWQKSKELVSEIYVITKLFPNEEKYALSSQIQRSAISIASNIAEGSSRTSLKEQLRFTEIAYSSLLELYCQLLIAKDIGYLNELSVEPIQDKFRYISNKLGALRNSQQKRINLKP